MFRLFFIIVFSCAFILGQYAFGVETTHINIGRGDVDVIYPSDYSEDQPLPVIIALHGFTGNKKQLDNYWKLSKLVDHKKFILVYPQGTKDSKGRTFWNATEACCNMEHLLVDDAGYLMALLDTIEQEFPVDSDSIHFIGWSNGGFMSYRLACEHSDRIASFVSLAGANYEMDGICANASPVHVLQVHGTEDKIVEYGGGCWPDEITEGIKLTFPQLKEKIVRVNISVDNKKYYCSEEIFKNKENLITYMPRKKKNNSEMLLFILNQLLPKNWKIESIDNLTELEVANFFRKSKIFLSFSDLEGLGLPPIESALCGNHVIGYTGEGGKEFWSAPIFDEVFSGDLRTFANKVINKVKDFDKNNYVFDKLKPYVNKLAEKYSVEREQKSLTSLIDKIKEIK